MSSKIKLNGRTRSHVLSVAMICRQPQCTMSVPTLRPPKEKPVKECKLCARLGHPCKRHSNGPVVVKKARGDFRSNERSWENQQKSMPKTGANGPQPDGMWWCIHHKDWQPHRSPECPLLEDKPEGSVRVSDEQAAQFTDPWDCGRCREEHKVCKFHRSMEASGHTPPKNVGGPRYE